MNKKILYRKAYRLLDRSTPLKFDCGELCGKKCCSGDREKGMLLFPDEEIMFAGSSDFLNIRKENLGTSEVSFAVCGGACNRQLRPLSCRIFPLVPYIGADKRLTIIKDPRARYLCPLLMDPEGLKINKLFYRRVLQVFRLLAEDTGIRRFVETLSQTIDEYSRFTGSSTV